MTKKCFIVIRNNKQNLQIPTWFLLKPNNQHLFWYFGWLWSFPCVGAIEKQKLVYILNRDAAARLTISSPLEAHKANTLVYHVVGVDVGFENPMFACLEMDYEVKSWNRTLALQMWWVFEISLKDLSHLQEKDIICLILAGVSNYCLKVEFV